MRSAMCWAFYPRSGLIKLRARVWGDCQRKSRRQKNDGGMVSGRFWRGLWVGVISLIFSLAGCSENKLADEKPTSELPRRGLAESMGEEKDAIPSGGKRLHVEARGRGRAWYFSYCDPNGTPMTGDNQTSKSALRLPAHTEVVIHLRSHDYIYVFSCPELNLKEIAVPDLEFSLSFRTGGYGRYELAMDAMCGFPAAPGETMGVLHVISNKGLPSWLESCQ